MQICTYIVFFSFATGLFTCSLQPIDDAAHVTNLHRHFNNNIRFHEQHSEVAYAEAQVWRSDPDGLEPKVDGRLYGELRKL